MDKKTALITGSYGGLGTCFVNIHAGNGGGLILVGRSQTKLDEQAESVKKQYGVEVHTVAADLSSQSSAPALHREPSGIRQKSVSSQKAVPRIPQTVLCNTLMLSTN